MQVPGFIARQFYVAGSLRNTERGFSLQAKNPLGDGTLIAVGRLSVDGRPIDPARVSAVRTGSDEILRANEVTVRRPIRVRKGETVTLHVDGERLEPGEHRLEVVLDELTAGRMHFAITDRVR